MFEQEYFDFRPKRNCENCVHCEMYDEYATLCRFNEKWILSSFATYCEHFVQDGGSNE